MKIDGMMQAIALHGSRGLSKRAKHEHEKLLAVACFGAREVTREMITGIPEPVSAELARARRVNQLRAYAKMAGKAQARKLLKEAEELENQSL